MALIGGGLSAGARSLGHYLSFGMTFIMMLGLSIYIYEHRRKMKIDNNEFTVYYSPECPYVEYEVKELSDYAKEKNIKITFIKIDSLEKAKNTPCIFNNWANFYKGKFISNTILNKNSFKKLLKD